MVHNWRAELLCHIADNCRRVWIITVTAMRTKSLCGSNSGTLDGWVRAQRLRGHGGMQIVSGRLRWHFHEAV